MKDLTLVPITCICALTNQPIRLCPNSYKHLAGLPLVDLSDWSDVLDILICCDYYCSFITGKSNRGDSGPVGVHPEL